MRNQSQQCLDTGQGVYCERRKLREPLRTGELLTESCSLLDQLYIEISHVADVNVLPAILLVGETSREDDAGSMLDR